jgi:hypothetical protein
MSTKKPAKASKTPTMRFRLDGHWWRVKIMRPPDKELCWGICHYDERTIYLHPKAMKNDLLGTIVHEVGHATIPPTDETHIRELERVTCAVVRWAAGLNNDQITIGQHKAK